MRAHATPTRARRNARLFVAVAITLLLCCIRVAAADAAVVTISGNAYFDEAGHAWAECNGVTPNVSMRIGLGVKLSTSCSPTTGGFSFTPNLGLANDDITVFLDPATPGSQGATFTHNLNTSANITGLQLVQNRVWLRSESGSPVTNAQLLHADSTFDGDIPVSPGLTMPSTTKAVVGAGVTWQTGGNLDVGAVHVVAGATFDQDGQFLNLLASGTGSDCTLGAHVQRPLCIDAGATYVTYPGSNYITFAPDDGGTTVVEGRAYNSLQLNGNAANVSGRLPTFILGDAPGETVATSSVQIGGWCGPGCPTDVNVDSGPFHPDVSASSIDVDASSTGHSSWYGTGAATITIRGSLLGAGRVDLPGANVTINPESPIASFGPNSYAWQGAHDWVLHSLTIAPGTYVRPLYGTAGFASSYNSAAAQVDAAAGVAEMWDGTTNALVGTSNVGAASSLALQVLSPAGALQTTGACAASGTNLWQAPLGATTARGIGMQGWPINAYSVWGDANDSGGSTDGFVMLWQGDCTYKQPFGSIDGADAGAVPEAISVDYDGAAGGYDSVRGVYLDDVQSGDSNNPYVEVAGSMTNGAGSRDFGVIEYSYAGALRRKAIWNSGGANVDTVVATCFDSNSQLLYVVGNIPGASGPDIAVKQFDLNTFTWVEGFGNTNTGGAATPDTYVYNSGGANADVATGCTNFDGIAITGTRTVAGNSDIIAFQVNDVGIPREPFGSIDTDGSGLPDTFAYGGAGNEGAATIATDGEGLFLGGQVPANGGDEAVLRVDRDGELDTTWWMGGGDGDGIWTRNVAGADSVNALVVAGNDLYVGATLGSNGGDLQVQGFDTAGDLRSVAAAGSTRIYGETGATGAVRNVHLGTNAIVGSGVGAGTEFLDLENNDLAIEADGFVSVKAKGWLRGSTDAAITSRNDFNVAGGFTPNRGEVDILGQQFRAQVTMPAAAGVHDQFYDLVARVPAAPYGSTAFIEFSPTNTTRITHRFDMRGASCTSKTLLDGAAGQATIDTTGATLAMQYLDFGTVTFSPAITVPNADKTGSTVGVTLSPACATTTILAPNGQFVHDTNAQGGANHPTDISSQAPHFSWFNRQVGATREQTRVYSDVIDGDTVGLWHLDGSWADASPTGTALVPGAAAAAPTPVAGRWGNAISCDGGDKAVAPTNAAWDQRTFTFDTWMKAGAQPAGVHLLMNHEASGTFMELGITNNVLTGKVSTSAGPYSVGSDTDVLDNQWHHVALTQRQQGADWTLRLYVDGVQAGMSSTTGLPDLSAGGGLAVCANVGGIENFTGLVDEPRMLRMAAPADRIRGYVRAGRPHGQLIWDSDPTNTGNNFAGNVTVGTGSRTPDVVYGGAPGSLVLDGARYYVQVRTRAGAGSFSSWSEGDWFETRPAPNISVTTGAVSPLGTALAGNDAVATSSVQVQCTGSHGYTVQASAESSAAALSSGVGSIPWWTGTPATPTTWPAGTAGYVGATVLSASGGKDTARWGTGVLPTDFATLKYAGLDRFTPTAMHSTSAYSAATDTVVVGWRADPGLGTKPGFYSGTVTLTAVANP